MMILECENCKKEFKITNCPDDLVVDHINRNTLDNRKCNLRCVTIIENNHNRSNIKNVKY